MSGEPIRMRDDPSVPEGARRALDAAAAHAAPIDHSAGLARLESAMAGAGAAAGGLGATALWIGLGAAALVATGIGAAVTFGVGASGSNSDSAGNSAEGSATGEPRVDHEAPTESRPATTGTEESGAERLTTTEPRAVHEPPVESRHAATETEARREARGSALSATDRTALEVRLVGEARTLLEHEPALVLARLDRLDREVPGGFLGVERDGLRVLALAALGRSAEARRRGEAFLAGHPSGALADRVRRAID